jgi:Kef-type K+ transport system membrane component KefB
MVTAIASAEIDVRVLLAVAIVIVASRLFGWAVAKLGQPRVHGEILAGIVLGPSVLGLLWSDATDYVFPTEVVAALRPLSQLGLVVFMFLIGLELDLNKLRGQSHKAVLISHASIIAPMALGAMLGLWLYPRLGGDVDRLGFVLFLGAAMAITAFPVLARVLQETGLTRTRVGVLTMTCAAVDDVTAWCVLAGVVAIVESTGPADAARIVALSLAFVAAMLMVVRPALRRAATVPLWVAVALALAAAWTTEEIGIHAIFGAFMAGTIMPRDGALVRRVRDQLEAATLTLLLPIFFVIVGLATRIDMLDSAYLWGVTGMVIAVAIAGKWGGSMLAARLTGETWREAAVIGLLMNTRGLTELVILTVGLELGVITTSVFTIMVVMALVTTLMATPLIALVAPREYGLSLRAHARAGASGEVRPDAPEVEPVG